MYTSTENGKVVCIMWQKIKEKFIDLTSDVKVDQNGKEHIIPYSFKEFLWEEILIIMGIVLGVILF